MTTSKHNFNAAKPCKDLLLGCFSVIGIITVIHPDASYAMQNDIAKGNLPQTEVQSVLVKQTQVSQNLSRADFIQLMDVEFRKRDLDGNGKATRIEVEEFTKRATTAKAQEQNRTLFQTLDTDKNGALSSTEFAALVPAPKFIDVSPEMTRFDSNRDQIISLVEYRTSTLANFDRMDADKDGNLSASELSKLNTPQSNQSTER